MEESEEVSRLGKINLSKSRYTEQDLNPRPLPSTKVTSNSGSAIHRKRLVDTVVLKLALLQYNRYRREGTVQLLLLFFP